MSKKEHFKNYEYIKDLIDNGYESKLFSFNFSDDTQNSCLVEIVNKGSKTVYKARFGLSVNRKKEVIATLLGFDAIFFWNNYGIRTYSPEIITPISHFKDLLYYQLLEIETPQSFNQVFHNIKV